MCLSLFVFDFKVCEKVLIRCLLLASCRCVSNEIFIFVRLFKIFVLNGLFSRTNACLILFNVIKDFIETKVLKYFNFHVNDIFLIAIRLASIKLYYFLKHQKPIPFNEIFIQTP